MSERSVLYEGKELYSGDVSLRFDRGSALVSFRYPKATFYRLPMSRIYPVSIIADGWQMIDGFIADINIDDSDSAATYVRYAVEGEMKPLTEPEVTDREIKALWEKYTAIDDKLDELTDMVNALHKSLLDLNLEIGNLHSVILERDNNE